MPKSITEQDVLNQLKPSWILNFTRSGFIGDDQRYKGQRV